MEALPTAIATAAARMMMEVAGCSVVVEEAVVEVISIEKKLPALAVTVQLSLTQSLAQTVTIVWTVQIVITISAARMIVHPSLPPQRLP